MSSRPFDSIVIDIDFIRLCSPANWSDLSCFAIRGAPARKLYLILSIKLRKLFSFILRLLLVHVSTFGIREQKPTQEKKSCQRWRAPNGSAPKKKFALFWVFFQSSLEARKINRRMAIKKHRKNFLLHFFFPLSQIV